MAIMDYGFNKNDVWEFINIDFNRYDNGLWIEKREVDGRDICAVNIKLCDTTMLNRIADCMRMVAGKLPLFFDGAVERDEDCWWDFSVGINELDGGSVDFCIEACVVNGFSGTETDEKYYIDLSDEERKIIWQALDRELKEEFGEDFGCKEALEKARKEYEDG